MTNADPSSTSDSSLYQPPVSRTKRLLGPLLRIPTPVIFVGSVVLALAVLWFQGVLQDVGRVLGDASIWQLTIAVPVYLVSLGLLCYRWHLLVIMAQGHSNLPRASEAFLTSVVINYAAPIGLAVPSRAALTKRALGLDASATGTIAVWEIGMDVIVLGTGSVIWLIATNGSGDAVGDEMRGSLPMYGLAFVAFLLIAGAGAWWFMRRPGRREKILKTIRDIVLAPRLRPASALRAFVATAIYWIMQGAVIGLLVDSFGVSATPTFVLGLTSLPILVGMLSPIPGGAVVREALMYAVSRLANVDGDPVIAAALVYRLALFAAIPILYVIVRWWIARQPAPETTEIESALAQGRIEP